MSLSLQKIKDLRCLSFCHFLNDQHEFFIREVNSSSLLSRGGFSVRLSDMVMATKYFFAEMMRYFRHNRVCIVVESNSMRYSLAHAICLENKANMSLVPHWQ